MTAGEYVHPVATVKHYGMAALEAVRQRKAQIIPRYADGGMVGAASQGWDWLKGHLRNAKGWVTSRYESLLGRIGNSWPAQAVRGAVGATASKLGDWIKSKVFGGDGSGPGVLGRPVPANVGISWPYGWRTGVFGPGVRDMHNGLDFRSPVGTPVYAAGPGRVVVGGGWNYMGGRYVELAHPSGYNTGYFHLSSAFPRTGQIVTIGQRIGSVGNTGAGSRGPHLHWMVGRGGSVWNHIDPARFLSASGPKLYDNGGVLPPGDTWVRNATGHNEYVINPERNPLMPSDVARRMDRRDLDYLADRLEKSWDRVNKKQMNDWLTMERSL